MGFSADGRHLLVAALTGSSARFREGRNVLKAIDLEDGAAATVALPAGLTTDTGPVLAPDGRTAALLIDGELWLLPLAAGRRRGRAAAAAARRAGRLPVVQRGRATLTYLATGGPAPDRRAAGPRRGRSPCRSPGHRPAGQGSVLIRAGRVFDGIGPDYQRNVDILLTGNRIVAVGPNLAAPAAPA